jgi:hypothetical protein
MTSRQLLGRKAGPIATEVETSAIESSDESIADESSVLMLGVAGGIIRNSTDGSDGSSTNHKEEVQEPKQYRASDVRAIPENRRSKSDLIKSLREGKKWAIVYVLKHFGKKRGY